ncbi:MAG: quinolinate synthase NadA, partial [Dehalococcoidia bacterium]|nr:quinolinate synthase NadA [Dehalococcoidia bacterium]
MSTTEKIPYIPLTEVEQSAFCRTDESLDVRPLAEEFAAVVSWQSIPTEYHYLGGEKLADRIRDARDALSTRLVILGHHYQRDEVVQFADFRGDSLKLSQEAASQPNAEFIVFCGVHFMAETADILSALHQKVVLPNSTAGCSMSDMARTDDVLDCWDDMTNILGEGGVIPITYMNSTAAIKALCGRNGGIVCTSSNAPAVMKWAFERGERVVFFPDQHLGRNTGHAMGIPLDQMVLWNWRQPSGSLGGVDRAALDRSRIILWQGHCSVHQRFSVTQIESARERYPDAQIVVHPECRFDVVEAADAQGSTAYIERYVNEAAAGSVIGVGTEINLVSRLA